MLVSVISGCMYGILYSEAVLARPWSVMTAQHVSCCAVQAVRAAAHPIAICIGSEGKLKVHNMQVLHSDRKIKDVCC